MHAPKGGVAERLNAPVLKTGIRFGVSRVRIPPPPLAALGPPTVEQVIRSVAVCRIVLGLMVMSSALLGGCLAGSSPVPAHLELRDALTGAPVGGAEVRTTGGNIFIPPRDVLGPPISPWANPAGGRFETAGDGGVDIVLAGNRPNELTITADGYAPLHMTLRGRATSIGGVSSWTLGRLPPINDEVSPPRRLEVRVRTNSSPTQ